MNQRPRRRSIGVENDKVAPDLVYELEETNQCASPVVSETVAEPEATPVVSEAVVEPEATPVVSEAVVEPEATPVVADTVAEPEDSNTLRNELALNIESMFTFPDFSKADKYSIYSEQGTPYNLSQSTFNERVQKYNVNVRAFSQEASRSVETQFKKEIDKELRATSSDRLSPEQEDIRREEIESSLPRMMRSAIASIRNIKSNTDKESFLANIQKKGLQNKENLRKTIFNVAGAVAGFTLKTHRIVKDKSNLALAMTITSLSMSKDNVKNGLAGAINSIGPKSRLALGGLAAFACYVAGSHDLAHTIMNHTASVDMSSVGNALMTTAKVDYSSTMQTLAQKIPTAYSHFMSGTTTHDLTQYAQGNFASLHTHAEQASRHLMDTIQGHRIVDAPVKHAFATAVEHVNNHPSHIGHQIHHVVQNTLGFQNEMTSKLNDMSLSAARSGHALDTSSWLNTGHNDTVASYLAEHSSHANSFASSISNGSVHSNLNGNHFATTSFNNGVVTNNENQGLINKILEMKRQMLEQERNLPSALGYNSSVSNLKFN